MTEIQKTLQRGAFIVFEGCDKSGKTTQSKKIVEFLENQNEGSVEYLNFPARNTPIGDVINAYLTNKQDLSNQGIHLLFSANRWEMQDEMRKMLESGTTLICDRYSYSGVAYSVGKGLCYNWCKAPEKGLLRPDLVIYLKAPISHLSKRGDFGLERYEETNFQHKVESVFTRLCTEESEYWMEANACEGTQQLFSNLSVKILKVIKEVKEQPFRFLW